MIDLHTHTTASDGRHPPDGLVSRAARAGVTVLAVTDHDTVAGCAASRTACDARGIAFVPGIEITAVRQGREAHVLGYFFDVESGPLATFLSAQRRVRIERVREMVHRLAAFGIHLDADAILRPAADDPNRAAGRPWIARALVDGGHVATTDEAFDRWLAHGRPAYVPRTGASIEDVIDRIHEAGGIASIAHPRLLGRDEWLPELASAGLDALEAYHSEHDEAATAHYLRTARQLGVGVSGGSDFHGDPVHGPDQPGRVSLPRELYEELLRRKRQD